MGNRPQARQFVITKGQPTSSKKTWVEAKNWQQEIKCSSTQGPQTRVSSAIAISSTIHSSQNCPPDIKTPVTVAGSLSHSPCPSLEIGCKMTGKKYANCLQLAASLKLSFIQTPTPLSLQLPWSNSSKIQIIPFERMARIYVNAFEEQANTNTYCRYGKHWVNKGTVKKTPGSWHCSISHCCTLGTRFLALVKS